MCKHPKSNHPKSNASSLVFHLIHIRTKPPLCVRKQRLISHMTAAIFVTQEKRLNRKNKAYENRFNIILTVLILQHQTSVHSFTFCTEVEAHIEFINQARKIVSTQTRQKTHSNSFTLTTELSQNFHLKFLSTFKPN